MPRTTSLLLCIESDGVVANFSARQHAYDQQKILSVVSPSDMTWLRRCDCGAHLYLDENTCPACVHTDQDEQP